MPCKWLLIVLNGIEIRISMLVGCSQKLLIVLNGIEIDMVEIVEFLEHPFNRTKWN